jgi:hypothetical protein
MKNVFILFKKRLIYRESVDLFNKLKRVCDLGFICSQKCETSSEHIFFKRAAPVDVPAAVQLCTNRATHTLVHLMHGSCRKCSHAHKR